MGGKRTAVLGRQASGKRVRRRQSGSAHPARTRAPTTTAAHCARGHTHTHTYARSLIWWGEGCAVLRGTRSTAFGRWGRGGGVRRDVVVICSLNGGEEGGAGGGQKKKKECTRGRGGVVLHSETNEGDRGALFWGGGERQPGKLCLCTFFLFEGGRGGGTNKTKGGGGLAFSLQNVIWGANRLFVWALSV
jgi:hypothetical protein